MHDKPRRPDVFNHLPAAAPRPPVRLHRRRIGAAITFKRSGPLFGIPGRVPTRMPLSASLAAGDARPAPDNERDVLDGKLGGALVGLSHVACSDVILRHRILLPLAAPLGHWLLSTPLPHLDNDLPFGSTLLEIRKRRLRLFEWKYFVDHRPNAPCLEKLTDLCELTTVWMHEQERIRDTAFLGVANYLTAQQPEHEHHEKVHLARARECGVRWPDEQTTAFASIFEGFLDWIAPTCPARISLQRILKLLLK
jgi:hypothetical protein